MSEIHTDPVAMLARDMREVKDTLSTVAEAVVRLARLEERHAETREAQKETQDHVAAIGDRVVKIEVRQATQAEEIKTLRESRGWMLAGLGLILIAVIGGVVHLVVK